MSMRRQFKRTTEERIFVSTGQTNRFSSRTQLDEGNNSIDTNTPNQSNPKEDRRNRRGRPPQPFIFAVLERFLYVVCFHVRGGGVAKDERKEHHGKRRDEAPHSNLIAKTKNQTEETDEKIKKRPRENNPTPDHSIRSSTFLSLFR